MQNETAPARPLRVVPEPDLFADNLGDNGTRIAVIAMPTRFLRVRRHHRSNTAEKDRLSVDVTEEVTIDVEVRGTIGGVNDSRRLQFRLDHVRAATTQARTELMPELVVVERAGDMAVAAVRTLRRLAADGNDAGGDLIRVDILTAEVVSGAVIEPLAFEVGKRLLAQQVSREIGREQVSFRPHAIGHAKRRHVVLGVVDPPRVADAPGRIVDVKRQRIGLDDTAQVGIREQRMLDVRLWILQLGDRIRGASVEQVLALAAMLRQVPQEVLRTQQGVKARQSMHLVMAERLARLLAELRRAHGFVLGVGDSQQRDRTTVLQAQAIEHRTEALAKERVVAIAHAETLEHLVHGKRILDLEDAATQQPLQLGRAERINRVEKALRQTEHVDLHQRIDRHAAREAVLVVRLPFAVARHKGRERSIVLGVQTGESGDDRIGVDRHIVRQNVEGSHARTDVRALEYRTHVDGCGARRLDRNRRRHASFILLILRR